MSTLVSDNTSRNFMSQRGTRASRNVIGADGDSVAVIFARNSGAFGGRRGNFVSCVLQRVNAAPRYLLQFFQSDGTQIGSNILVNGADLDTVASTLASDANGRHFSMTVYNVANQATEDTGNGFANSTKMSGGA